MEKILGIDKLKKEVEDGVKVTLGLVNEIETAKRGLFSNWKFKNIKLANRIRKNNRMLLYKSCIIKVISTKWIDSIQYMNVQNNVTPNMYMEVIQKDETKIHCSLNIVQQSTVFDYLKLLRSLYQLKLIREHKILYVISNEIEKKALSILKLARWNIDVINLNM